MLRQVAGSMILAAMLAGCSKAPEETASAPQQPPNVALSAALGVAFAYRYAFRLPFDQVAAAQEAHAQACERLGVTRCRITGMQYRVLGEKRIEGMLSFRLAPDIARRFGKSADGQVRSAGGALVDAEITGTDAGSDIAALTAQRRSDAAAMKQVETDLARRDAEADDRIDLQMRQAELQRSRAAADAAVAARRDSLAATPMTFTYESGAGIGTFDTSAPFTSAAGLAWDSVILTITVALGLLGLAGPPALLVLLLWWLWRRFARPALYRLSDG